MHTRPNSPPHHATRTASRTRLRRGPAGLLVCLCLALPACEPQPGPQDRTTSPDAQPDLWVASDMLALTETTPRTSATGLFDDDGRTVRLQAAANETLSLQLVLDAGSQPLRNLRVQPTELREPAGPTLPPQAVRCFRMLPVRVETFPAWYLRLSETPPQPGRFYDPLLPADAPAGGQPWTLQPGKRLALWVDLAVPRTAEPGLYEGSLRITADGFARSVPLRLDVLDVVLPDSRALPAIGGFDHHSLFSRFIQRDGKPYQPVYLDTDNPQVKQGLGILRHMMRLAHEHRLDLFDKRIRPKINRDAHGQLHLFWTDYDTVVKPFLTGEAFDDRIGVAAWPLPVTDAWPVPDYYGGIDAPTYAETFRTIAHLTAEHLRQLGSAGQVFAWPQRGSPSETRYAETLRLARLLRLAAPNTPILTELPTDPPAPTGWTPPPGFAEHVDILAPPAQWLDPNSVRPANTDPNPLPGVWFQPGLPPYAPCLGVLARPADVRALPWIATRYRCAGLFLPEVLNWQGDLFASADGSAARLFYPGDAAGLRTVMPSVRLKRLRRGLQDIAYLWILRQRGRPGIAEALLDAMVRYAALDAAGDHYLDPRLQGWVHDGASWRMARLMLIREVLQALHPSAENNDERRTADRVRWNQFRQATSSLAVERVQTVMRSGTTDQALLADPNTQPSLRAIVQVELFNQFSRPLDVDVRVTDMPAGWRALVDEYSIPQFPPRTRRTARLVIEGKHLPPVSSGKIPLSLTLAAGGDLKIPLRTDVPFLVAGRFNQPPTIDGKLDDWPMRPNNSAGNFRLLGLRGLLGREPSGNVRTGLAKKQTVVFAMQDNANLYFAFRCNEPHPEAMAFSASNKLHWNQLLLSGEDLVELLLDPGADAKGPEDLYHLVIKPNGVMIAGKGIGSDPPLGPHRRLALGADLAIHQRPDLWTVELRIPRAAFGPAGQAEFWGANFMRFSPQNAEASSWTGAQRYFYDPRNLGTLFVKAPTKR